MRNSWLFGLLLLVIGAGCDSKSTDKAPPAGPILSPPAAKDLAPPPRPAQRESVEVTLLPPNPTCTDDLYASVARCNDNLSYSWEINAQALDPPNNRPQLVAGGYRKGETVTVRVQCGSQELSASTQIQNSPPVISQIRLISPKVVSGQPIEIEPVASDADDETIIFHYQWSVDDTQPVSGIDTILPGEYVQAGKKITVTVIPVDPTESGLPLTSQPFSFSNAQPYFTSTPLTNFSSLEYRYQAIVIDPDGDQVTYSLVKGPEGMRINESTGEVVWKIKPNTVGDFEVSIVAKDSSDLSVRQTYSLQLSRQEAAP